MPDDEKRPTQDASDETAPLAASRGDGSAADPPADQPDERPDHQPDERAQDETVEAAAGGVPDRSARPRRRPRLPTGRAAVAAGVAAVLLTGGLGFMAGSLAAHDHDGGRGPGHGYVERPDGPERGAPDGSGRPGPGGAPPQLAPPVDPPETLPPEEESDESSGTTGEQSSGDVPRT